MSKEVHQGTSSVSNEIQFCYKFSRAVKTEQQKFQDYLLGRLLTLSDATFSDPEQRKAFKDMVRNVVHTTFHDYSLIENILLALGSRIERKEDSESTSSNPMYQVLPENKLFKELDLPGFKIVIED